jgi:hypothetical protein
VASGSAARGSPSARAYAATNSLHWIPVSRHHAGAAVLGGASVKGTVPAGAERCTATPIGFIGSVRPGETFAARSALGGALLAPVSAGAEGHLVIAQTANGMSDTELGSHFSRWAPLLSQSQDPQFRSCDMLISDKPAAQPIIAAAIAAIAAPGYSASPAALRSELQEVLISDNPLQPGTVIVTSMVPGAAYQPLNAPVLHHLVAYTAVVNVFTDQVTGVAQGGL